MKAPVTIKTNTSIEVNLTTRVVTFEFEPFKSKEGASGIGVYFSKSPKIQPALNEAEISEAKILLQQYATKKNALLKFE